MEKTDKGPSRTAGPGWLAALAMRLVLVVAFFLVVTPAAVAMRLLHLLRFSAGGAPRASYWTPTARHKRGARHFERQS